MQRNNLKSRLLDTMKRKNPSGFCWSPAVLFLLQAWFCEGFTPPLTSTQHLISIASNINDAKFRCGQKCFAATSNKENETIASFSKRLQRMLQEKTKDPISSKGFQLDGDIIDRQSQAEILSTRMADISLNRTYTGPSTISGAGTGLFARESYPEGTLLTCYPGDALVVFEDDEDGLLGNETNDDDGFGGGILWGDHVPKELRIEDDLSSAYMLRAVYDEWGIIAMSKILPVPDDEPAYLGHFANDGIDTPPVTESDLSLYVLQSNKKANAMHQDIEDCHMVTVATKDILKDEEIFVTYGPEYWMDQDTFGAIIDTDALDSGTSDSDTIPISNGKGFG